MFYKCICAYYWILLKFYCHGITRPYAGGVVAINWLVLTSMKNVPLAGTKNSDDCVANRFATKHARHSSVPDQER